MKCWQMLLPWVLMVSTRSLLAMCSPRTCRRGSTLLGLRSPNRNFLNLGLVSVAPKSPGYRAIKCSILALKTKPVDRQFTIRLFIRTWSQNNQRIITVEQSGELPAGALKSSVLLRLPQPGNWDYFGLETFVDGRRDDELCQEYITTNTSLSTSGATPEFQVLRVSTIRNPPAGGGIKQLLSLPIQSWRPEMLGIVPRADDFYQLYGLEVEHIPGDWQSIPLDYTTYDAVSVTVGELNIAATQSPRLLKNLLHWVASGGMLWIEGGDESPENVGAFVDSLKQLNEWRPTSSVSSPAPDDRVPDWEVVKAKQPDTPLDEASPSQAADSGDWYLRKRWGFGEIYAFRAGWNELPRGDKRRWLGNLETIANDTVAHWRSRAWAPRHGLQPDAANSEYSTFLIPGVGLAPVVEFEVLITLFVLIIGPLNYLLLRAYDRLHLMVLTTPLCALVASAGLFGYAVIADGFGAEAQDAQRHAARSILRRDGEPWPGLAVRGNHADAGLSVPADTAIYPILPGWNENSANEVRQPPKELVWTDSEQQLTSGWIPSRTTAQYYTLRANKSERKLHIVAAPDKVRVTNDCGAAVDWLFVNDDANQTWIGPKLAVDASAQLKPIDKIDAVGQFRELCLAADPQFPAGYDSNMSVNNPRNRRGARRQANGSWQPLDYSNIAAGNSLMEQYLDELSGLTGAEALNLPPRSYVAITNDPTEQPVPLKDAEQLSGFHVTVGRW